MVTKRSRTPRRTPSKAPVESPDETPYDPETVDEGVTLFDSTGEDTFVRVKRLDEATKKWEFQFRLAPHEATEEYIQGLRGGGQYRCIEMVPNQDGGGFVFGRQRTIVIAGPPKELTVVPEEAGTKVVAPGAAELPLPQAAGAVSINDIMAAGILDFFKASQTANQAAIQAIKEMGSHKEPQQQWLTPEVMIAVTGLIAKLMERKPEERPDLLGIIEQVTNIVRQNANPSTSFKDTIEVMNEVLDLKDRSKPDSDDPMMALLGGNVSKIIDIIATKTKEQGRTPTVAEVRAAAATQTQGALPPAQPAAAGVDMDLLASLPDDAPVWQKVIASHHKRLIGMAQADKDPNVTADYVLMMLPDKARGGLREFVAHGQEALNSAFTAFPELAKQQVWFTQFFARLYEDFFGDEEEPEVEEVETEVESDVSVAGDIRPEVEPPDDAGSVPPDASTE